LLLRQCCSELSIKKVHEQGARAVNIVKFAGEQASGPRIKEISALATATREAHASAGMAYLQV
jgi:hypothetical protein